LQRGGRPAVIIHRKGADQVTRILIDRFGRTSFHDGLVRIECLSVGPDGKPQPAGTLLMSGAQAGRTLGTLVKSLQELQQKVQKQGTVGQA
jgi:hypothetical protein